MKPILLLLFFFAIIASCSVNQKRNFTSISYAGGRSGLGHMIKVNATVSGEKVLLIFDTGIGVNLISKALCLKLKCKIDGSVTGKRMTGQSVTIPMSKVKSLQVADQKELNVDVGVLDLESFLPNSQEFEGVQGYLSLNFFKTRPFTIDYNKRLLVFETPESLNKRLQGSEVIPILKKEDGSAFTIQVAVKTQLQKKLIMQLDLGTNITIINSKYLNDFKPYLEQSTLKRETIIDETKYKQNRFYVRLNGNIVPYSKKLPPQKNPTIMFQNIIYDGMIGNDFFKDRVVTYDLNSSKLLIKR